MDRKKIETKYKWNLSDLCATDSEVYDSLDRMQARMPEIKVYQGKLKSENKLLAFLKLNEEIEIEFERISTYAYLHFCENQEDHHRAFFPILTTVHCARHQDNPQVVVLKTEYQIRKFRIVALRRKDMT